MTTWQPKAVEAGCLAIADYYASKHEDAEAWSEINEDARQEFRAFVEAALRAALPLIEVTPGMMTVGKDSIGRYFFKYDAARHCIQDALRACASEGKDQ
jgi:hypothetical protein